MLNTKLYKQNNQYHHFMSKQLLDEFSPRFNWRPDGQDSLLDIGCGPGDVTADVILPLLPNDFSRLVCADISEKYLNDARLVVRNAKASFQVLDIGTPLDGNVWTKPFDHITSFNCLHWIQDKRPVMKNIFNLLNPGGNCLLANVCQYSGFTIFNRLAKQPRYSPYMQDIEKFMPPFQFSENPSEEIENILNDIGFSEFTVEIKQDSWTFNGMENLKCKSDHII